MSIPERDRHPGGSDADGGSVAGLVIESHLLKDKITAEAVAGHRHDDSGSGKSEVGSGRQNESLGAKSHREHLVDGKSSGVDFEGKVSLNFQILPAKHLHR